MECAAAIHFMRNRGWEKIIHACLEQPSVRQHQVGAKSWEAVCKTWWENFASMCVYAWRSAWFSGADLGRLRNHSMAMGAAPNELQWGKLLWTTFREWSRVVSAQSWALVRGTKVRSPDGQSDPWLQVYANHLVVGNVMGWPREVLPVL